MVAPNLPYNKEGAEDPRIVDVGDVKFFIKKNLKKKF